LAAYFEILHHLVLGEQVERLIGDEGEWQADIGRHRRGIDPIVHKYDAAEDAELLQDLAFGADVDALHVIGGAFQCENPNQRKAIQR